MAAQFYTASKSRSNRPGWSVSFRHPLRNDARGKPGLKMRRGLGTGDGTEADALVAEMNTILSDSAWWSASRRQDAERQFSKVIVDAFYDEIQAGREQPEALRESVIRLPNSIDDDYSRVLLVGTTGAGKTSLLRQFIGSDPDDDRFPSTAPAKTTIADIEVIQSEGNFEGAVTFFNEFQIQASVEECVSDACLAAFEGAQSERVVDRFLNHRDQKFRLSYVLGGWRRVSAEVSTEDDFSFSEEDKPLYLDEDAISEEEQSANRTVLEDYLDRLSNVTKAVIDRLKQDLGGDHVKASGPDREAAQQLIEENFDNYLYQDEQFHEIVQDVLDEIRSRFERVEAGAGKLRRCRSGWPEMWVFGSADRSEFIRHIRWFSSNYWPQFGRLLTPLVQGIRVKGPLFPHFAQIFPKLVLIDGQGLGHSPDSSSSVTTHVTSRFGQVNVILLVDSAQQPMQAAPLSVFRAVASSGHHKKLAVAFTHFDHIKGHNLRTFADKRAHVMASVLNALSGLRDVLGAPVVKEMENGVEDRCFMLGGVDRRVDKLPSLAADYMRQQLSELVGFFERAILPPPPPEARPVYDPTGIYFAVREAVIKFQGPWLARLGLDTYEGVKKEHWTRVKALNRRIAGELDVEYDTLRPVADLVARLTESISRFLDEPFEWTRQPSDDSEAQAAISEVRREVSAALHEITVKRLIEDHLSEWRNAYDGLEYKGSGSASRRARTIYDIYDAAAPLPDSVMPPPTKEFLFEIRRIATKAIEMSGGEVKLSEAA